jgi:hypothetical protein
VRFDVNTESPEKGLVEIRKLVVGISQIDDVGGWCEPFAKLRDDVLDEDVLPTRRKRDFFPSPSLTGIRFISRSRAYRSFSDRTEARYPPHVPRNTAPDRRQVVVIDLYVKRDRRTLEGRTHCRRSVAVSSLQRPQYPSTCSPSNSGGRPLNASCCRRSLQSSHKKKFATNRVVVVFWCRAHFFPMLVAGLQ